MIKIYRYLPAWTVPCISPYVTKACYYMSMAGLPYEPVSQDLTKLDVDSPTGKLPYIVEDDGTRVVDSTDIIRHLRRKHPGPLDEGVSAAEDAQMLAWNRLIDDHLYWTAVIQPRWRETPNWEKYLRIIAGTDDVPPPLRAFGDDFRHRILLEFMQGGWGRMSGDQLYARAREDVDALSNFLGDKTYFMGAKPRWIDAAVLSILRHTADTPFTFDTKDYVKSKQNLTGYMDRMKERFGI